MISQIRRASSALVDFGERLADFQMRAAHLESQWLSTGLHLTADGLQFTVPHGYASLAHDVLATLRGFEAEAVSDVTAMWHDITGAAADLVTVLKSVIEELEDFQAISYTAVSASLAWAFKSTVDDVRKEPWGPTSEFVLKRIRAEEVRADHNLTVAENLAAKWSTDLDPDARAAGRALVLDAKVTVKGAKRLQGFAKIGGHVVTFVNVGYTVAETARTASKHGWISSIEDHSGDLASLAAGIGLGIVTDAVVGTAAVAGTVAAAPVLIPVGIVVGGGLLCAGVGAGVKYEVTHHKTGTTRALNNIGDGIKDSAVWTGNQTGLIPQPAS
jgi:hypothetical protein